MNSFRTGYHLMNTNMREEQLEVATFSFFGGKVPFFGMKSNCLSNEMTSQPISSKLLI